MFAAIFDAADTAAVFEIGRGAQIHSGHEVWPDPNFLLMKMPTLLAAAALSVASFCSAAERRPPAHPTMVFAEYKGQRHLVVAADQDKPVILIEGKRQSLPNDTPLFTERAADYSGRIAKINDIEITKRSQLAKDRHAYGSRLRPADVISHGELQETSLSLVAAQDLRDCYLVMISYEDEFLMDAEARAKIRKETGDLREERQMPNAQIRLQQVADLTANQSSPVNLSLAVMIEPRFSILPGAISSSFRVLTIYTLFSEGREVRTNQPETTAAYFLQREKIMHAAVVDRWLKQNRGANLPLKPIQQIPPLLDSVEGLPNDATATLSIGADGIVIEVGFDREFPAAADGVLRDTLHAWLFLPRLQEGKPVAARVKLPLRF